MGMPNIMFYPLFTSLMCQHLINFFHYSSALCANNAD